MANGISVLCLIYMVDVWQLRG